MIVFHFRGDYRTGNQVQRNQILPTYSIRDLSRSNTMAVARARAERCGPWCRAYPQNHFTVYAVGEGKLGGLAMGGLHFALLFNWQNKTKLACSEPCIRNEIVFFCPGSAWPAHAPLSSSYPLLWCCCCCCCFLLLARTRVRVVKNEHVCVCVFVFVFVCCFICIYCCTFLFFFRLSCCCPFLARLSVMRYLCFMYLHPAAAPPARRPATVRRTCSLTPHIFVYDNILLRLPHVAAAMCSSLSLALFLFLSLSLYRPVCFCRSLCVGGCLPVMDGHILMLTEKKKTKWSNSTNPKTQSCINFCFCFFLSLSLCSVYTYSGKQTALIGVNTKYTFVYFMLV